MFLEFNYDNMVTEKRELIKFLVKQESIDKTVFQ